MIRLPAKYPSIERSIASISSSPDLSYTYSPYHRHRMYASLRTPLLLLHNLVNTPLHKPLHVVDNERRCSTSIISNAPPEIAYAFLLSVLFPLPLLFPLPFSPYGSLEGLTHKNTTTQPPHRLVLVSCSILLRLPGKGCVSTLGSAPV